MQDKDQQIVDSIKSELNESVDNINAKDLSAITQARYQALARKKKKSFSWMFVPAGVVATACLAVVVYNFIPVAPESMNGQNLDQENYEFVSAVENFDIYEDPELDEELDFYEWLDTYESSSQG
jgi:negative regulator of sigma E activity